MSGSAAAIGFVAVGERVDREVGLHAGLRAHPLDDAADPRRELAGVEAPGGAGDVAHQPARELDLVQDPQHREHGPQVGGHGLLEGEQLVDAVLDLEHPVLDLAVGVVDLVDDGEVGVEQGLGGGADLLAALDRQLHDLGPDLLELFVERPPGLDHDVLRNSCSERRESAPIGRPGTGGPRPGSPAVHCGSPHGHPYHTVRPAGVPTMAMSRGAWRACGPAAMLGRRRSLAEGRTCPQPNRVKQWRCRR